MSESSLQPNVTPIRPPEGPPEPPPPTVKVPDCCGRLVSEVATLSCVRATLVAWDLADETAAIGRPCIASTESVLQECIKRLHDIVFEIHRLQSGLRRPDFPFRRVDTGRLLSGRPFLR